MANGQTKVSFDYLAPHKLAAACLELSRNPGATIIAGGTDLMPRWRNGLTRPDLLIDLRLLGLDFIMLEADLIRIGACTTHSQIIASELFFVHYPALVEACKRIASPPIRNRGTLGGNLVNASPAADTAPPLLAYDAELVLAKHGSERTLPFEDFFIGSGMTAREADEILTEVRIPARQPGTASKFLKLGKRQAMAIAVASAAVRITLRKSGEISQARIVLGSVAPRPMRARNAEALLVGKKPGEADIFAAARLAQEEASPISDIRASKEYRSRMVEVLVRRSLSAVFNELVGGAS